MYDPQLWDLADLNRSQPISKNEYGVTGKITKEAAGRKVVVALGTQSLSKGFPLFCTLWCDPDESVLRRTCLFVACGKVDVAFSSEAKDLQRYGGILLDRVLTDEEMMAVYGCADLIWCCYPPFYNQASGIFGRAVQLGVPTIVRAGSYLALLAKSIRHPIVELNWEKPLSGLLANYDVVAKCSPTELKHRAAGLRFESVAVINSALGIVV
jgi:hypothetical protein